MRSPEDAFDHDGVLSMVHLLEVVAEVGKCGLVLPHQPADFRAAVVDLARGHDLVAGPSEERNTVVELVGVLRGHVAETDFLSFLSERLV